MTTKKYELTVAMKADIHVVVKGVPMEIPFANGRFGGEARTPGYYETNNTDIQDSLENGQFFNKIYVLKYTRETSDIAKKVVPEVKKEVENKSFPNITNGQAAKKILVANIPGLTFATVPTDVAGVRKLAKAHNIEFPNWN